MTTDRVRTHTPHRVDLPARPYLTPTVRAAAEKYLALDAEFHRRVAGVQTAQRAVGDAGPLDARESAAVLAGGGTVTKPRARVAEAEVALSDATAMRDAYRSAVSIALGELREAVVEAAPEWAEQVAAEHVEAVARYEAAAAALASASRDIVASGGLLGLLRNAPSSLMVGTYRPAAALSIADSGVSAAVEAVKAQERTARGPVA